MDGDERPRLAAPPLGHGGFRPASRETGNPPRARPADRPPHSRRPLLPRSRATVPIPLPARDVRALEAALRRPLDRRPGRIALAASPAERRARIASAPDRARRRRLGSAARERGRPRLRPRAGGQRRLGGHRARALRPQRRSFPRGAGADRDVARAGAPRPLAGATRRDRDRRPQGPRHASGLRAGHAAPKGALSTRTRRGAPTEDAWIPRRASSSPFRARAWPCGARDGRTTGSWSAPRRYPPTVFRG